MDTTETTYAATHPALAPLGGPHFAADEDDPAGGALAWTGDPGSVPLAAVGDAEHRLDADADPQHRLDAGSELDRVIFAALVAP